MTEGRKILRLAPDGTLTIFATEVRRLEGLARLKRAIGKVHPDASLRKGEGPGRSGAGPGPSAVPVTTV